MSVASLIQSRVKSLQASFQSSQPDDTALSRGETPAPRAGGRRPWGYGLFSLPDIRAWVRDRTIHLQETIAALLRNLPAAAEGELTLITGPDGSMIAVGDHPYKHALIDYINNHQDLLNDFSSLAVTASLLRGADGSHEFQKAYRQNPEAAIAQYEHLLGKYAFGLSIVGGLITPTYFERALN